MASKKNLKKDINYLIDEVIGTSLMHQSAKDEKTRDEIDQLIKEMLTFREELLEKVNQPPVEPAKGKKLKEYYRDLYSELLSKVNKAFEQLNKVVE